MSQPPHDSCRLDRHTSACLPPPAHSLTHSLTTDANQPNHQDGWDLDIKEDVEDECGKYGAVQHVHVDPKTPGGLAYALFAEEPVGAISPRLGGVWILRPLPCLSGDMHAFTHGNNACTPPTIQAATKAAHALNGRWFAGRMVSVGYITEPAYKDKCPDAPLE